MAELTLMEQKFVVLLFSAKNPTSAARMAGYSEPSVRTRAYQLTHDQKVQAAILEESRNRVNVHLPRVLAKMMQIADRDRHPEQGRMLIALKNLGGMPDVSRVEHTGTIIVSHEDKRKQAYEAAVRLGLDPAKYVGAMDAEFAEVDDFL